MTAIDTELTELVAAHDIIALGMRADDVRRALHGARTTFVRVATLSAEPGGPLVWPAAAGELRIEGVPSSRGSAVARVSEAVSKASGAPVSGFSLADLERLAREDGQTLRAVLEDLAAAGLEVVSEAPLDLLHDPRRAIEQVNIAGLILGRLTIHRLESPDVFELYGRVVELQRETGVIRAFAPLPREINRAMPTTGFDDVTHVALARLIAADIPSIQVDWTLYGPKLAQIALTVGADDVDAVSSDDDDRDGRRRSPLEEIRRNIRVAGFEPVQRNGRFETIA
jgi:aminodeoxyfutalosine synthase